MMKTTIWLARLQPGVTVAQAQADIATRIRVKDKRDSSFGMHVISLLDQVVGDVRRALLVLLGSVLLVLLSACANVANILLTRAAGREKEVAIRTALEAGWQRLVRQLLTESLLYALMGGVAGLALAWGGLAVMRAINPGNIPRLEDIHINASVLAFTLFCLTPHPCRLWTHAGIAQPQGRSERLPQGGRPKRTECRWPAGNAPPYA